MITIILQSSILSILEVYLLNICYSYYLKCKYELGTGNLAYLNQVKQLFHRPIQWSKTTNFVNHV